MIMKNKKDRSSSWHGASLREPEATLWPRTQLDAETLLSAWTDFSFPTITSHLPISYRL